MSFEKGFPVLFCLPSSEDAGELMGLVVGALRVQRDKVLYIWIEIFRSWK